MNPAMPACPESVQKHQSTLVVDSVCPCLAIPAYQRSLQKDQSTPVLDRVWELFAILDTTLALC